MDIQLWRRIFEPYALAVDELEVKFNHVIDEYHDAGEYCPIEQVKGRVKSLASVLEKAQRKKIPIEMIEEGISDIAGIRIICQLVEDIYKVAELIRARKDNKILAEKDYIRVEKDSGYRSFHMDTEYCVETRYGTKKLSVEIQIRTLAMNFWATVEHSFQYKYKGNIPDHLKARLHASAQAIKVLDQEMSSVRSEIIDAQNSYQANALIVADSLNTIQSLYKVANKREIMKVQDEFFSIYEIADVDELVRFKNELDILAEGYMAQAVNRG
jgi:putative GTP pyrophosphokinase